MIRPEHVTLGLLEATREVVGAYMRLHPDRFDGNVLLARVIQDTVKTSPAREDFHSRLGAWAAKNPFDTRPKRRRRQGNYKMSWEKAEAARAAHKAGRTARHLALEYGVAAKTMRKVLNWELWRFPDE